MVKVMIKAHKIRHAQEYTTAPSMLYGCIPYTYQGEHRMLYILNNSYADYSDVRLYGINKDRKRVNITPPPGYSLSSTPGNLGFESIEMIVDDDIRTFTKKTIFVYPPPIDNNDTNEYPLHAH